MSNTVNGHFGRASMKKPAVRNLHTGLYDLLYPTSACILLSVIIIEPSHHRANEVTWAPGEDSNQHGHPSVFALHSNNVIFRCAARTLIRLKNAKADLRLLGGCTTVGFAMKLLISEV